MTSIKKPLIDKHLARNDLGLTVRDYEGVMSTLCAGCGHDSVTAAITRAFFELSIEPHRAAKVSGIGCSSKTTAYFAGQSHGINAVHGRMPSVATGAAAANNELHYIGVSGDGDSLSIGLGQFCHAIRRNVNMLYIIENNGVYGLTKGQFSASADVGSKPKKGPANEQIPIDPVKLALTLGASFVARSFSGDKKQLVPLIQAGLKHNGFALIDVISPCVTFNDHPGSTKSYAHTFEYFHPIIHADYVDSRETITAEYDEGAAMDVDLHDGSTIRLRKTDDDYDPTDIGSALNLISQYDGKGEILTGLLHVDKSRPDMQAMNKVPDGNFARTPYENLCPGADALKDLQKDYA